MTTDESGESDVQESDEVQALRNLFDVIAGLDVEKDLVRTRKLGIDASFAMAQPLFEEVQHYVARLQPLDWQKLTPQMVSQVTDSAENVRAALQKVREYTVEEFPQRESYIQEVRNKLIHLMQVTIPFVGFLSWETINLEEMTEEMKRLTQDATKRVDEMVDELDQRKQEADKALEAIRGVAAAAGVELHTETFKNAAERHEKASWWWLVASGLAAAVTVVAAILMVVLWDVNGDISDASVLQLVVVKGIAVVVGLFVTTTCVRMYRSQIHLATVNRHREDALRTFKAFAEGTDTPDVKDKVLLEATHAIFGQVATGLIDERGSRDIQVLEAVTGSLIRRGE